MKTKDVKEMKELGSASMWFELDNGCCDERNMNWLGDDITEIL